MATARQRVQLGDVGEAGSGDEMVRVVATRLMRAGEVALWSGGRLVWRGQLGSEICDIEFDAISVSTGDHPRLQQLVDASEATSAILRAAVARWWD